MGSAFRPADRGGIREAWGRLPLTFEANRGQTHQDVKFLSHGSGYTLFLTAEGVVLSPAPRGSKPGSHGTPAGRPLRESSLTRPLGFASGFSGLFSTLLPGAIEVAPKNEEGAAVARASNNDRADIRLRLMGMSSTATVRGLEELPGKSNYFIGNDPGKWHVDIPNFAKVEYQNVYPGVDAVYYGNQRQLELDFIVAPGVKPEIIRFAVDGAAEVRTADGGDLSLIVRGGEFRLHKPVIYQDLGDHRRQIAGRYVMDAERTVGFEVEPYDATKPLVIDPVLAYSTFLGGNDTSWGAGIAVDSAGNAYVTGTTRSTDFPVQSAFQSTYPGRAFSVSSGHYSEGRSSNAFVTKLNPSGSAVLYSTYLGGRGSDLKQRCPIPPCDPYGDSGNAIAIDAAGNAYITGITHSDNFPTVNALQRNYAGDGDAFITKLNPTGNGLVYSTYLGGTGKLVTIARVTEYEGGDDRGMGIAVDGVGNAYVTGTTYSPDNFPVTNAAWQKTFTGSDNGRILSEAFAAKIHPSGSSLLYCTYIGGEQDDTGSGIVVDGAGNAYIVGSTRSQRFPVTPTAFQSTPPGMCVKLRRMLLLQERLAGTNSPEDKGISVFH